MESFNERVAVVTGGASGIGRAIADSLKSEGAHVVIADRARDRLAEAREAGFRVRDVDVTDAAALEGLATETVREFGRVDIVFNNAGVGLQQSFANMSLQDWRWVLDVNTWGIINGLRAFLPHLHDNPDGGHVVNTSSILGLGTMPGIGAYVASKYAVVGLTLSLAQEQQLLGDRIGVTLFCPGPVESNINESLERRDPRYGDPDRQTQEAGPVERTFFHTGQIPGTLSAPAAARIALDAVRVRRFWAVTHPDLLTEASANYQELMASVGRGEG